MTIGSYGSVKLLLLPDKVTVEVCTMEKTVYVLCRGSGVQVRPVTVTVPGPAQTEVFEDASQVIVVTP